MHTFDIPKPVVKSEEAHSEIAPSGAKRWISCPGSVALIRSLPKARVIETNFYAKEGTAAHELSAYCLTEGKHPKSCIGRTFNEIEVDHEMARHTLSYIEYIDSLLSWTSQLWVEVRMSLEHIETNMFGTADAVVLNDPEHSPFVLDINDLKYGKGVFVDAIDNYQLKLYAIGVLSHLAKHNLKYGNNDQVRLTIIQPRLPHRDGPIRSDIVRIRDLKDFQIKAIAAIEEANSDDPSFHPDEDTCRWCEAAPICKANASHNLEVARLEFADFSESKEIFLNKLLEANTLTDKELLLIYKHGPSLKSWIESIETHMRTNMQKGHFYSGYKIVYGRSNRAWKDIGIVAQRLIELGVNKERMYNQKLFSPAQMENTLENDEFEYIKDLIFKPTGKVTITTDKDARPAIDKTSEATFDFSEDKEEKEEDE